MVDPDRPARCSEPRLPPHGRAGLHGDPDADRCGQDLRPIFLGLPTEQMPARHAHYPRRRRHRPRVGSRAPRPPCPASGATRDHDAPRVYQTTPRRGRTPHGRRPPFSGVAPDTESSAAASLPASGQHRDLLPRLSDEERRTILSVPSPRAKRFPSPAPSRRAQVHEHSGSCAKRGMSCSIGWWVGPSSPSPMRVVARRRTRPADS